MSYYNPTEEAEMRTVCEWLRLHNICFAHPANEGMHKVQYRRKQVQLGLAPGLPDLLIFDVPPKKDYRGTAIELKRRHGGVVTAAQKQWLADLEKRGWFTAVCYGADEVIELLTRLGYGRRTA